MEFWKDIFKALSVKLTYFTAYHAQTDESFKQINQITEIVLQFFLCELDKSQNWQKALSCLQAAINFTISVTTDLTLNEIKFRMKSNMSIDLLNKEFNQIQDFSVCIDATETIKLAQMLMKCYYDNKHLLKFFDVDDKVML